MRLAASLLGAAILFCCLATATAQSSKVRLSDLSTVQLEDCYTHRALCGNATAYEVSNELASRLKKLPSSLLVACFADWKLCGAADNEASGWQISDELASRKYLKPLLKRYWTEPNEGIRWGIIDVAYHFDTPAVAAFMKRVMDQQIAAGKAEYWPVNYMAKRCDPLALRELAKGTFRNEGCMQYETSMKLFGKCRYKPAVPYLVDDALNDMCLNITDSGEQSLKKLFPDAPRNFRTLPAMRDYYCLKAKEEGFKVDCKLSGDALPNSSTSQ